MEILTKDDFETLEQCPWDNAPSDIAEFLYQDDMGGDIVRCPQCGIVYAKRRLNESGLPKHWGGLSVAYSCSFPRGCGKAK